MPGVQSDFNVLSSHNEDRVLKKRLQIIHIASGIHCWLHFDENSELAESSQIIRDCILHTPMCK